MRVIATVRDAICQAFERFARYLAVSNRKHDIIINNKWIPTEITSVAASFSKQINTIKSAGREKFKQVIEKKKKIKK